MSRILLLNGSPRGVGSNSRLLANAFVEGLSDGFGEGTERREIILNDCRIEGCRGCFCCWGATPGSCVIRDDMQMILEAILQADAVVAAFPLYYFGLPGPVKTMLDRTLPLVLPYNGRLEGLHEPRYDLSGKRFALVSSCGYGVTDGLYDALKKQADMIFAHGCARVFCPQGEVLQLPSLEGLRRRYLNRIREAGREFAETGMLSSETVAAVSKPLLPQRAFEKIVEAHWAAYPGAMTGKNGK